SNLLVGEKSKSSYFLKSNSSSTLISIGEYFSSFKVMMGDVFISVLHSQSIPCFSSTVLHVDRYSCRKSSNSSPFISCFTEVGSCVGSVNPDILDFSSVLKKKNLIKLSLVNYCILPEHHVASLEKDSYIICI